MQWSGKSKTLGNYTAQIIEYGDELVAVIRGQKFYESFPVNGDMATPKGRRGLRRLVVNEAECHFQEAQWDLSEYEY